MTSFFDKGNNKMLSDTCFYMPSQAFGFTGLAVPVGIHNSVLIHKQNIRLFERILSVKEALRQIGNAYRVTQAFGNAHYDRFAVNVFNAICSGVFADYIVENRKLVLKA